MGESANLRRPDRPWLGTGWALLVLVFLIVLFVSLVLGALFVAGTACSSGGGSVSDGNGAVIQSSSESCSPTDWTPALIVGVFAALVGLGLLLQVREMRRLAQRWNSPLFDPAVWTFGSGAFLGLVTYIIVSERAWATHKETCSVAGCTGGYDFEPVAALVVAVIITALAIPFLLSLRRLITTWLSLRPAH